MDVANPWDLSGKVAVLTGAGGSIGRESALTLARAGASVVLTDVDRGGLDATQAALAELGQHEVLAEVVDVADRAQVHDLAQAAAARHGRIDIWANIAGLLRRGLATEATTQQFDEQIGINLGGVLWGCQAAAEHMKTTGGGAIVNVTSGAADEPSPAVALYAIAKAAASHLSRTLAVELGPSNIRVNAISPGYVESGLTSYRWRREDGTYDEDKRQATLADIAKLSPIGRTGEPIDIALSVLYLVSDASRFMTGQVLRPNGGVVMP